MPKKIKVSTTALSDIDNAIIYYNKQQKGLGRRFENIVNKTIKNIKKFPLASSFAYENVRYKVLEIFPFTIFYEVEGTIVYILRVFNDHQKPIY